MIKVATRPCFDGSSQLMSWGFAVQIYSESPLPLLPHSGSHA
jgi:hypothetical protein